MLARAQTVSAPWSLSGRTRAASCRRGDPVRKEEREIETRSSRRSPGGGRVRRRRAGAGDDPPHDAVRAGGAVPGREDTGRVLEHRGPVRDRPGRPGRHLRFGELRQQVPGRGGRLHGHRPRRDLRRGGGDRGRLPAVRGHAHARRRTPRLRPRSRPRRTTRSPACSHSSAPTRAILDGDYAAYLAAIPDGAAKPNGIAVGRQVARAVLALRANDGRGCSTTLADLGPPAPAPGVWQPAPGSGARPLPARDAAARARRAPRSSGPTAPTR